MRKIHDRYALYVIVAAAAADECCIIRDLENESVTLETIVGRLCR